METPFLWLNSRKQALFAIRHEAVSEVATGPCPDTIICCSPIFEEKQLSHRVMVEFARLAACRGYQVLRFDYFGDGESAGEFADTSLATRREDIQAAIDHVRREFSPGRIFLLGLRLGATLAMLAAVRADELAGVVAWDPILDTGRYLHNLLRSNLSQQMVLHNRVLHDREALVARLAAGETVNIDGYDLGGALYHEAQENELKESQQWHLPLLVVEFSKKDTPRAGIAALIADNRTADITLRFCDQPPFWRQLRQLYPSYEPLFDLSLGWIASRGLHPEDGD